MEVDAVRVRTVHSEALRQLQWMWPRTVGGSVPRVQSSKIPLVITALANKMARAIWAMMTKKEDYRDPARAAAA